MRRGDVRLLDEEGQLVAELTGLRLRRAGRVAVSGNERLEDWLYEMVWEPRPDPTPSLAQMAAQTDEAWSALGDEHNLPRHHHAIAALEISATAYILQALRELGWEPQPHDEFTTIQLADQLGVTVDYRRLLHRYLTILSEEDILEQTDGNWRVMQSPQWWYKQHPETAELTGHLNRLVAEHPASAPHIKLTARCGEALAEVLQGTADPLQLLFPNGSFSLAEQLYSQTPEAFALSGLLRETMAQIVADWPMQAHQRPLRVLEIGAGTGGGTAGIVPVLPLDQTEYVCTDLSSAFLKRAEHVLSDYPFMRYQIFDVEKGPQAQGLAANHFDVVVAVNVLHATGDLRQSLRHVRQLLVPGGLLLVVEATAPERWIDVTFGLTEGWWRFHDTGLRSS
jgi:SAM-dependent methyltransferase